MVSEVTERSGKKLFFRRKTWALSFCAARNLSVETFPVLLILFLHSASDAGYIYVIFGDISSMTRTLQSIAN
jgi:hypothetical protein